MQPNKKLSREAIPPLIHFSLHPPGWKQEDTRPVTGIIVMSVFFHLLLTGGKKEGMLPSKSHVGCKWQKDGSRGGGLIIPSELSDNLF